MAFVSAAIAAPTKTLVWEDLVPKFEGGPKNPFDEMELYRQLEIETIQWARSLTEEERKADEFKPGLEDALEFEKDLRKEGLDVDKLVQEYTAWQGIIEERGKEVVAELNGKPVKLAGYLLPLEFSETGQNEFLLVPYIGACIHAPVPPPNQIVFIELNQSFKVDDLFMAVWVTGTMKTQISSKALSFVDGTADIPLGYTISAGQVEPYTEVTQ
ncbi:MAG: DUF3299 domain-containing protein [Pseudomonadota bacterium]